MKPEYNKLVGKLVVVAHWSDFKLEDATFLGLFDRYEDGYFYIQGNARAFRYCRKVSERRLLPNKANEGDART